LIDTHCHLEMCEGDPAALIDGLVRVATVAIDDGALAPALSFADLCDQVYAIVGRHPNSTSGFGLPDLATIEFAARHPKVVAIGETGLDYYRDYAPHSDQRRAFEAQIELAREVGKPLVIHVRAAEAVDDALATLAARADGVRVVMHCFSAAERLDECVDRGYFCSFAGNVTYPNATDLQDAATRVPDDLLLVETDSPFLAPQPVRGKPNVPGNVVHTARRVAELRGVPYEELERLVEDNSARVFGW
jgi:TatD DNase family protein